jgi:hypothetical protein
MTRHEYAANQMLAKAARVREELARLRLMRRDTANPHCRAYCTIKSAYLVSALDAYTIWLHRNRFI